MTESTSNYEYQVGGSLPIDSPSYVTRQADTELYKSLLSGEFCYVLNSRQMGKSSLRVRTMQKLQAEGFICAFIDLTGIGKEDVTAEKWYAGIVQSIVSNCQLSQKINWRNWWRERKDLLSPVQRLSLFVEEVLLVEVERRVFIFVDEIDRVLSQNFSLDDFFALIRYFYNKRVDSTAFQRLTFALLGVATPSNLITDKTQTPFNIGKAIELHGFQLDEAQPLAKGLEGKVEYPQAVIQEILNWTGGQPFLTQKICQLVFQDTQNGSLVTANSVCEIVQKRLIENWETQDEPEHLKTIRDRILRNEQKTGRLLGIYQEILQHGECLADGSSEQTELRLSGLVVQQQGKLKVYNQIYLNVFNQNWVDKQLEKLRPYSQNFRAWVISDFHDESRLLRGQALQDALSWANHQSLSTLDYRFLAASQDLENREVQQSLAVKEEESRILAQANETLTLAEQKATAELTQAKRKARRITAIGSVILAISLVTAAVILLQVKKRERELAESNVLLLSSSSQTTLAENPFEAMLKAVKAAQKLKELETSRPVKAEIKKEVTSALQQVIYSIRERHRLQSHQGAVRSVSFSPDGKFLASGSEDDTVKLWDKNGSLLFTLKGHHDNIWSVNFSPDGKILASASDDGTVKLWNVQNGLLLKTIAAHREWVRSVSFSRNGKILASSSSDGTIKLWNVENGTLLNTLKGHRGWVTYISFSPDGKTLASAGADTTIKLWNLENGTVEQTLKGHRETVRSVSFSPDGKTLASGSEDNTIKLWNLENGKELKTLAEHRSDVWSVVFSPDGKTLASASSDSTVKLWNIDDINDALPEPQTLRGHQGRIWSVVFSPDGKTLASGSVDKTVKLWSLNAGEPQTYYVSRKDVISVSFSPDGKILASAGNESTIKLRDMQNGNLLFSLKGHTKAIRSVRFSPNGQLLASASSDKTVRLWNVKDGTPFKTLTDKNRYSIVRFSPDGKILAAQGTKRVKLWNVEDGTPIKTLKEKPDKRCGVKSINFSPDGKTLAVACSYGNLQLWDVTTETVVLNLKGHSSHVSTVSFSPDGKILASGSADSTVKLWKVADGSLINTITAHLDHVRRVTFSPDGKTLASASDDKTIKLWNIPDGSPIKTLKGHRGAIISLSFTPDGKTLASGSSDNTVRIWNLDLDGDYLLKRSCLWLKDYLTTHPQEEGIREICLP
ncbi:AAA-like domain-containing protein [Brasilonema sp. UFV-L1]|uniref:WD40 domain-containing protein n=1 Tax=Brasilonema sp. UFV-L1 TaxID=2234130 RepID=UPI00145CF324|nr:AAA-like domain-containing protein [Brasilonema sp. UFV-L1]NMG06256.1 hypothetical protein [Brasilonema sp. UFV-L1]